MTIDWTTIKAVVEAAARDYFASDGEAFEAFEFERQGDRHTLSATAAEYGRMGILDGFDRATDLINGGRIPMPPTRIPPANDIFVGRITRDFAAPRGELFVGDLVIAVTRDGAADYFYDQHAMKWNALCTTWMPTTQNYVHLIDLGWAWLRNYSYTELLEKA